MNHTPKIIEKIGLEIHDIYLNCKKSPRGTPFLSKKEGIKFRELLYQIHTQAKVEERERVKKLSVEYFEKGLGFNKGSINDSLFQKLKRDYLKSLSNTNK